MAKKKASKKSVKKDTRSREERRIAARQERIK